MRLAVYDDFAVIDSVALVVEEAHEVVARGEGGAVKLHRLFSDGHGAQATAHGVIELHLADGDGLAHINVQQVAGGHRIQEDVALVGVFLHTHVAEDGEGTLHAAALVDGHHRKQAAAVDIDGEERAAGVAGGQRPVGVGDSPFVTGGIQGAVHIIEIGAVIGDMVVAGNGGGEHRLRLDSQVERDDAVATVDTLQIKCVREGAGLILHRKVKAVLVVGSALADGFREGVCVSGVHRHQDAVGG